jgi:hypothetical protein|tara:strand:- start:3021 stop:3887 length:867 start_codon:yes stop_codon:yes gene_type:complete
VIFYRILDNVLYHVEETKNLGFEKSEGYRIPDEYLESQKFTIMRTANGIGDWGILSAMPRLLKQKYPNCRVYVPSSKLIKDVFGTESTIAETIFKHNPYVDKFKDYILGEVFHDHYRIYDKDNTDVPLLEQMLKFWQFDEKEYIDSQPEMYWSNEEKSIGDEIIKDFVGKDDFGCLLISDRFGTQRGVIDSDTLKRETEAINNVLEKKLKYFYFTSNPLKETPFNWIDSVLDMRHIDIRIQLYIKSKAKINVGNQCGVNHMVVRYSHVYETQRQIPIAHNFVRGENYL